MKPIPRGAYELMGGKLDLPLPNQTALDRPDIDGIRLKARWSDIETSPGVFAWSNLDGAVLQATNKNKNCGISVNAGIDCPGWLYSGRQIHNHAVPYTLVDTGGNAGLDIPTPGDSVFINRYTKFVNALGARYESNPTVSYVAVCGIGNHDESNIAGGPIDTANLGTPDGVNAWKAMSKTFIDVYASAFPTTTIFMVLAKPFLNSLGTPAMIDVSDYGRTTYGNHFGLAFNGLNANSTVNYEPAHQIFLHQATNPTWAQFGLSGGGTQGVPQSEGVDEGLRAAFSLGIRGVEIYKPDCDNDSLYSYTSPAGSLFQGQDISGTPAGITPRRADLLSLP